MKGRVLGVGAVLFAAGCSLLVDTSDLSGPSATPSTDGGHIEAGSPTDAGSAIADGATPSSDAGSHGSVEFHGASTLLATNVDTQVVVGAPPLMKPGDLVVGALYFRSEAPEVVLGSDWTRVADLPNTPHNFRALLLAHVAGADDSKGYTFSVTQPTQAAGVFAAYGGVASDPFEAVQFVPQDTVDSGVMATPSLDVTDGSMLVATFFNDNGVDATWKALDALTPRGAAGFLLLADLGFPAAGPSGARGASCTSPIVGAVTGALALRPQ